MKGYNYVIILPTLWIRWTLKCPMEPEVAFLRGNPNHLTSLYEYYQMYPHMHMYMFDLQFLSYFESKGATRHFRDQTEEGAKQKRVKKFVILLSIENPNSSSHFNNKNVWNSPKLIFRFTGSQIMFISERQLNRPYSA